MPTEQRSIPTSALHAALKCVWQLLQEDARQKPPIDPPSPLRPFMTHRKPPVDRLRQEIEVNDEFRLSMANRVTAEGTETVGWLWLSRPHDDWEAEALTLVTRTDRSQSFEKELTDTRQRLNALLKRLDRHNRDFTASQQKQESDRKDIRQRKRELQEAEKTHKEAQKRLEEAELTEKTAAKRAAEAETALSLSQRSHGEALQQQETARASVLELSKLVTTLTNRNESDGGQPSPPKPSAEVAPLQPPPVSAPRIPVPLPDGVVSDHPDAADFLLRQTGITLLLDGYNIAYQRWPPALIEAGELTTQQLRARLEHRINRMAASYRLQQAILVWDGNQHDQGSWGPPTHGRQVGFSVTFPRPGMKADEYLLEICESLNEATPVTFVTSDRGLAEQARRLGCNILNSEVLWILLESPEPQAQ